MPFIAQVAVGRRDRLRIFGDDYPTTDGTCERDYIHVEDLAAGHVAALNRIAATDEPIRTWNLGTGRGTSVLEMVKAFERASGMPIPYDIVGRRAGDLPASWADPTRANDGARLGRDPDGRRHVRGHVAVAEPEPERLRGQPRDRHRTGCA